MRILGAAAVCAAAVLIGAWLLMLTIGVIHHEWLPMMPTLGWEGALAISAMSAVIGFALGLIKAVMKAVLGDD